MSAGKSHHHQRTTNVNLYKNSSLRRFILYTRRRIVPIYSLSRHANLTLVPVLYFIRIAIGSLRKRSRRCLSKEHERQREDNFFVDIETDVISMNQIKPKRNPRYSDQIDCLLASA